MTQVMKCMKLLDFSSIQTIFDSHGVCWFNAKQFINETIVDGDVDDLLENIDKKNIKIHDKDVFISLNGLLNITNLVYCGGEKEKQDDDFNVQLSSEYLIKQLLGITQAKLKQYMKSKLIAEQCSKNCYGEIAVYKNLGNNIYTYYVFRGQKNYVEKRIKELERSRNYLEFVNECNTSEPHNVYSDVIIRLKTKQLIDAIQNNYILLIKISENDFINEIEERVKNKNNILYSNLLEINPNSNTNSKTYFKTDKKTLERVRRFRAKKKAEKLKQTLLDYNVETIEELTEIKKEKKTKTKCFTPKGIS